jgi:hypothetical protein
VIFLKLLLLRERGSNHGGEGCASQRAITKGTTNLLSAATTITACPFGLPKMATHYLRLLGIAGGLCFAGFV